MYYPFMILSAANRFTLDYVYGGASRIAIIDSGVHKLFHMDARGEYPGGYRYWVDRLANLWYHVSKFIDEVYAVVPDYPSDYKNNPIPENVERTLRNIEYALSKYSDVRWLIPIQGQANSVSSVVKSIRLLRERGLLRGDYIAIAPTCVSRSVEFLKQLAMVARSHLPSYKLHMFGVIRKAWSAVEKYLYSVDSIVYSFYCREVTGRKCTDLEEHIAGWVLFLRDLKSRGYLSQEDYEASLNSALRRYSVSNAVLRLIGSKP